MAKLLRRKKASRGAGRPVIPVIPASENNASNRHIGAHPAIPRFIRLFSLPILLFWLALVVFLNVKIPQLEVVGQMHSVSLAPDDAPSLRP